MNQESPVLLVCLLVRTLTHMLLSRKKRNCASVSYKEAELKPGIVVQHQCTQAVINHLGDLEEIEMTMKVPESSVRKAIQ